MSQVSNVADINFSTAFLNDKTCGIYLGTYSEVTQTTLVGGFLYQFTIPHNFTRPAFCDLLTSIDGVTFDNTTRIAYSDSSNFYILSTTNTYFVYYQLVTTWIDDYDTTNPLVTPIIQTSVNSAYFDSRYNYLKLLTMQTHTFAPTGGSDVTFTYDHNLGYTPAFKIYFNSFPGQIWPGISGGASDPWLYDSDNQFEVFGTINSTSLTLDAICGFAGVNNATVWFKIYYDA